MKLFEVLKGQDFNESEVDRIANKLLHDEPLHDHITGVIVDAWQNNGGAEGEFDAEGFSNDIQYAIDQLKRALQTVTK